MNRIPATAENFADQPWAFDFWQASAVVEEGGEEPRFSLSADLAFPATEVEEASRRSPALSLRFSGLPGPSGTLPLAVSERILEQNRLGNRAPQDFLDLFHNRLLQVWRRECMLLNPELAAADSAGEVAVNWLSAVAGMLVGGPDRSGVPSLRATLASCRASVQSGASFLLAAPVWSDFPHTVEGLRRLIRCIFRLESEVEQFCGCWIAVPRSVRTRLGENANRALGVDAVLGSRFFNEAAGICVRLKADGKPPRNTDALRTLIRTYLGEDVRILESPVHYRSASMKLGFAGEDDNERQH